MTIQSDEHKFFCSLYIYKPWASQVALVVKNLSINAGGRGSIPGLGRSLEKDMITHSSILAWRSPWTEEPGRLQYMGLHRVGHSWVTKTFTFTLYTHTHTHTHIYVYTLYLFIYLQRCLQYICDTNYPTFFMSVVFSSKDQL